MIYSKNDKILIGHGSGGTLSSSLIKDLFLYYFDNSILNKLGDSAHLQIKSNQLAFTTDSFVVDPLFFPGGNIGKLAVCGTVNDLAVAGAKPLFLSCSFILEEGFSLYQLEKIVQSMAIEAENAQISIVTGDTKVVANGQCDKLFINTSGIGQILPNFKNLNKTEKFKNGDKIIINGSIGDHAVSVLNARNDLKLKSELISDCASLNTMINDLFEVSEHIKFMRDATRGGLATVLCEVAENAKHGFALFEEKIPIKEEVRGVCEILGFDPLFLANEGKVVMVVDAYFANLVVKILKNNPLGKDSCIIGELYNDNPGFVWLNTIIGGKRLIDKLSGEQFPRIC